MSIKAKAVTISVASPAAQSFDGVNFVITWLG